MIPVKSCRFYKNNAFFNETSGTNGLSFRQAFAVESLARLNQHLNVYLLLSPPKNIDFEDPI